MRKKIIVKIIFCLFLIARLYTKEGTNFGLGLLSPTPEEMKIIEFEKKVAELENENNIEKLKEIAELIEKFDNKEVTKKELNKQYNILVKEIKPETKEEDEED